MSGLMINAALKGTAILAAAWFVAFLMRRHSAAARHVVWTAAFAALLALPFFCASLPALELPVGAALAPNILFRTSVTAGGVETNPTGYVAATLPSPTSSWHPDWNLLILLLWPAGTAVASLQMLAAWIRMARLRRRARPLDCREGVMILESPAGSMPASFGLLHPAVFLPEDAAAWSPERRRLVLLHELAHVRRGDSSTHLLARLALNLFWWNPLASAAWREFLKERERAADDLVLTAGACASDYAGHLLDIARTSRPVMGWAAVSMARPSQLEGRLLAILDSKTNRTVARRATLYLAVLAAVALVAPLAALRAQQTSSPLPTDLQVLDTQARTAQAQRQYDNARKLLDSALALRAQKYGQRSTEYAVGLLNLGELEARRNKPNSAKQFYSQAAAILGSATDTAPAWIRLGVLTLKDSPDNALNYFNRAQTAGAPDPGLLKMWMAVANDRRRNAPEADVLFQQALSLAAPDSATQATVLEVYAGFLNRHDRSAEAATDTTRALSIRKALAARVPRNVSPAAVKIGHGVSAPQLVTKIEPEYTEEARAAGLTGTAVLYVEVAPDGTPQNMAVIRGLGLGLDQKAIEAITQWRFKPGTRDGQPITVAAQIEVNFRLL